MVKVQELCKRFGGHQAVDQVSFQVKKGKVLVIVGKSGCGKTTTLKMVNRLIEPDQGQISIGGENITKQKPEAVRKKIGYVIQGAGLFPHYTVARNIGTVPALLGWAAHRAEERTRLLMNLLGLPLNLLHRYPHELSGGQQQRVGIARALAADPPLVLMDEPFGALDPVTRKEIQDEFLRLEELVNKTIIMVTHDVGEAIKLGDQICLMDNGKIVQQGTPAQLMFEPASSFVKGFFDPQRFQLQMLVVKLQDLLPLAEARDGDDGHLPEVKPQESIAQVLERAGQAGRQAVRLIQPGKRQVLACHQLLNAFYNFVAQKSRFTGLSQD